MRAAGYEIENGQLKNQEWVSPTFDSTADGALYFNVLDLAKWDGALSGTRLLQQSSLDRVWTVYLLNDGRPNSANYGFGWVIDQQNHHRRIWHSGAWQGFTCQFSRYPDDNLSVAVLTNLDSGHSDPALIARVVAGLADPSLLPAKLTAIGDSQPTIAALLLRVLGHLASGEDIRAQTTPDFALLLDHDARKEYQKKLATFWPGGTISLVQRRPSRAVDGGTISLFRLKKGAEAVLITFGLNANGKISALSICGDREYE